MNSREAPGRAARRSVMRPARRVQLLQFCLAAALSTSLLVACGPVAVDVPAVASASPAPRQPTALPHADEIRFALIGKVNDGNVWATFDSKGYSYNDYAIRSG